MEFVSVKEAYQRSSKYTVVQNTVLVGSGVMLVIDEPWVAFIGGGVWFVMNRSRRFYRAVFWNQAMSLHSSKVEGEPVIYEFMSDSDKRKHARRSLERFAPREDESDQ